MSDVDQSPIDTDAVHERLLGTHVDAITGTLTCAEAVAAGFETTATFESDGREYPATRDSRAVRSRLHTALRRAELLEAFATLLPDVVEAGGGRLSAPPAPGPPYVAINAAGPVIRATVAEGRLVVRIRAYDVVDGAFVWTDPTPATALSVEFRG